MQVDNIFIVHPSTSEQINALKAFITALKIKFEIANPNKEDFYNPAFVSKIIKSKKEFAKNEFTRVKKEDLQDFLGL